MKIWRLATCGHGLQRSSLENEIRNVRVTDRRADCSPRANESAARRPLPDDIRRRCDAANDKSKPASVNEMEHCVLDHNPSSHIDRGVVSLASEIA